MPHLFKGQKRGRSHVVFMNDEVLRYLENSERWEIGVGPSDVVLDEGIARKMTTTTGRDHIYAFIFGQKGSEGIDGRHRYTGLENHSHLAKQMIEGVAIQLRNAACKNLRAVGTRG